MMDTGCNVSQGNAWYRRKEKPTERISCQQYFLLNRASEFPSFLKLVSKGQDTHKVDRTDNENHVISTELQKNDTSHFVRLDAIKMGDAKMSLDIPKVILLMSNIGEI